MKNSTKTKSTGYFLKVNKSAVTGRFVTAAYSRRYPATTFTETIKVRKRK
ncbi:MAG: hypothetical protein ABIN36_11700 [Ferruginibacter sp.]